MDTNLMHLLIVLLSLTTLIILGKNLQKTSKDSFVVAMLILTGSIALHTMFFSIARLYAFLSNEVLANSLFFNWWSIFIKMHTLSVILWIGILALRRGKK